MTLSVVPAESGRDLRRFIDLPWTIYPEMEGSHWIPPLRMMVKDMLDTGKDPFWENADRALFLALKDGRPVGRIAAIENRTHNQHHHDRVGFFGFFESEDEPETAAALLDAAAGWLRERGLDHIRGPLNPSTNHESGLLVRGFRWEPFFLTPWTPRYYMKLLEAWGLEKEKDLLAYFLPADAERFQLPEGVFRAADRALQQEDLVFRDLDLSALGEEAEECRVIYNESWDGNWGFVPMSRDEFAYMAKELKPLLLPRFNFVAEVKGEAAGFAVVIPDFNQVFKRIPSGRLLPTGLFKLLLGKGRLRSVRIILMGVRPRFRRSRSLFPLFAAELMRRGRAYGLVGGEASWVLEDNEALNAPMRAMGAKVSKVWRVYGKRLPPIGP